MINFAILGISSNYHVILVLYKIYVSLSLLSESSLIGHGFVASCTV